VDFRKNDFYSSLYSIAWQHQDKDHPRMTPPLFKSKKPARFSLGNLALAAASLLVCLIILELVASTVIPTNFYRWEDRLMFFSGGNTFENFEGGFKYAPNRRIGSETYYINADDRSKLDLEYKYTFHTNNLGLVQTTDAVPDKPAILILGDSYVDGQGASPWFYKLEARVAEAQSVYQILNGGILGTGIEQFKNLYEHLQNKVPIKKAIIVFISNDWIRPVWQMPPRTLKCLADWQACTGDEDFYGLPAAAEARKGQIRKIADYRLSGPKPLKQRLRPFALVRFVWNATSAILHGDQVARNKAAAADLVKAFGRNNTLFIHLPQKDELLTGISPLGVRVQEYLHGEDYRLVDGFQQCNLMIADFHLNDGHPTAVGYDKVRICIETAIKTML